MKFVNLKKKLKQYKRDRKFIKAARRVVSQLESHAFLQNQQISFPETSSPEVSIIIPVYNQISFTLNCLYSIYQHEDDIAKEIIVVDDASTDETGQILSQIPGIKLISNAENIGYLRSVNLAIKQAAGDYIYVLNNDTKVQNGYLTSFLEVFKTRENVGAVGSKLIFPNNELQEAGCLVFKNKMIVNRGAGQSIDAPQFNFLRKVDYVSGCSLLFKRLNAAGQLNLYDEIYAPAYFEENDFCMKLKHEQGLDTYYQPRSEVIHFENVSYSSANLAKESLMARNSTIFFERWQNKLEETWLPGDKFYRVNDNAAYCKSILITEEYMPKFDQDSGSNRFTEIVKILVKNNHKIYLLIKNEFWEGDTEYIKQFQDLGVEILQDYVTPGGKIVRKSAQLSQIKNTVDFIWIFRPEGYEYYLDFIKPVGFKAKVIYDTVDLHYLRFDREKEYFTKDKKTLKKEQKVCRLEQSALKAADVVIAISDQEKETLEKTGLYAEKIAVVSNIHSLKTHLGTKAFSEREGLIFIGGYNHKPNVDAVLYLYQQIMPLVWKQNSGIKVFIVGHNVPPELEALHSENFVILGYQKSIDNLFLSAKAMVAPLRYGAGVKGKIGQALEFGLPVISTTIGIEGMRLESGVSALVAEVSDPETFAKHILHLYEDENLWNILHQGTHSALKYFTPENQSENIAELLSNLG